MQLCLIDSLVEWISSGEAFEREMSGDINFNFFESELVY